MKHVEKIAIIIVYTLVVIALTGWLYGSFIQEQANTAYDELEVRYLAIEKSNTNLQTLNTGLISNNTRLTGELAISNGFVLGARDIIGKLTSGVGETEGTIERIERTVEAIEGIIRLLPE